ncbi:hypothetical protein JCM3766R1_006632 [Sporobolomyces carnicolor]
MDPSHLRSPVLWVKGPNGSVQDADIVTVLGECLRVRLDLDRRSDDLPMCGTIEFDSLYNAEKAYATVKNQVFTQQGALNLHLSRDGAQDPLPLAQPRLLKSLPRNYTAGKVFDLCREFGPIHSATLLLAPARPPGSGAPKFKGQALVTFYEEEDAQRMAQGLHFLEVEGQSIIVAVWDAKRAERGRRSDVSSRSVHSNPPSPVPPHTKSERTSMWAKSGSKYPSTLSATSPEFVSPAMSRNVSGASQWSNNTGDTSNPEGEESVRGLAIDPCNLFVKSLDPSMSSQDLRNLFTPYGQIVSARVMTDPITTLSKEFGFVSFKEAGQASLAISEMDGRLVGRKHLTVRLHEPKKLRESRLSTGGATSSAQDGGDRGVEGLERGVSRLSTEESLPVESKGVATEMDNPLTPDVPTDSIESVPSKAQLSEHERLVNAVGRLNPDQTLDIVKLIEGLSKRERALCLFDPAILAQKVQDAVLVLEAIRAEVDGKEASRAPVPTTIETAIHTSTSTTRSVPASIRTLAELPSSEIVPLLAAATPILRLSTPTEAELESTRLFMEELEGLPVGQIKQKLGEKLFKVIKKSGVKRAPKITIDLLDTEDLNSLSVLIHYPELLQAKALLLSVDAQS